MTPGPKLLIGGAATAVLALLFHGPLNSGQGYINHLSDGASAALSAASASQVKATFQQTPLQTDAVLSGPVTDPDQRAKLLAAVKAVPGVHDATWLATDVTPVAPAPAAVAVAAVKPCADELNAVIKGKSIGFETGSAKLTDDDQTLLSAIAAKLGSCADAKLEIDGYTDLTGTPALNQTLSDKRAEIVEQGLVAKGAPQARLSAKGLGSSKPVADGVTPEANAKNRRVEFVIASAG